MTKASKILEVLRDDKPLRRLAGIVLTRLPFDAGKLFRINIRIQDYYIRLHSSSLSVKYWKNPNSRICDYKFITSYLKEDDIYIDVGANIGTTLIPAAMTTKGGKAIGFEPHPKIFSYLMENVSLNNLESSIDLHNCAIGNKRGYLNFSSERTDDCNKVLLSKNGMTVPVKLLDDFVENYSKIDLIKIDVEGYEKFVVEGGIKAIEKTACIYFEVSEIYFRGFGYSMKQLLTKFEEIGFSLYIRKQSGMLESINSEYHPSVHSAINVFAIRDINDFLRRTGWRIYDGGKFTGKPHEIPGQTPSSPSSLS